MMKILHFEDNAEKYMDIASVLRAVGETQTTWVESVEEGTVLLEKEPFDLIITDMHFPVTAYGQPELQAGDMVIRYVAEHKLQIPVITISSMRMQIPGAYRSIWYSDMADWEGELRACIKKIRA